MRVLYAVLLCALFACSVPEEDEEVTVVHTTSCKHTERWPPDEFWLFFEYTIVEFSDGSVDVTCSAGDALYRKSNMQHWEFSSRFGRDRSCEISSYGEDAGHWSFNTRGVTSGYNVEYFELSTGEGFRFSLTDEPTPYDSEGCTTTWGAGSTR